MTRHQRLELRPRLFAPVLRLQKGVGSLGHDQVDVCTGCKESGRNLGCLHRGDGARYTQADAARVHAGASVAAKTAPPTRRARIFNGLSVRLSRAAPRVIFFLAINDIDPQKWV
jgi:hypothetical protein